MSRCLSEQRIEHIVLDRGQIAERWRATSWHSLRLLTPNWMTRLPLFRYSGPDPDGFMSSRELVDFLERYARVSNAPVQSDTQVTAVDPHHDGFVVTSNRGQCNASAVVVATGYCDIPTRPSFHRRLDHSIDRLCPATYRSPDQLAPGGVLIVGGSATGVQLADEIHASGRHVTLAAGRHARLPRRYRGRDIMWWLDRLGLLGTAVDEVHDIAISRQKPSWQLIGRSDGATLDLATLHARGIQVTGRLVDVDGARARFDDDLIATTAAADVKLAELRTRIDQFIDTHHLEAGDPEPLTPTWPLGVGGAREIDLATAGIRTVVWATGYRRAYPWLRVPVLDGAGEIRQTAGITPWPGLYVLGMNFQRRRNSSFIDGVGDDAAFVTTHLAQYLGARALPAVAPSGAKAAAIRPVVTPGVFGASASGAKAPTRTGRMAGPDYDVIVAGARCAGAATALLLARAGARVLVVERGAHGTDTLSTHALMRGAVVQLARWGVLPEVLTAGTPPVRSTTFVYRTHQNEVPIEPRFGVEALYAPRRALLDRVLADAATSAGAEIAYRTTVDDIVRDTSGRVSGVVVSDDQGTRRLDAGLVVGADGLRSTIATRVGAPCLHHGSHAAAVLYSYWQGVRAAGFEWCYGDRLSVGAIPTNDGATCVFVSLPWSDFRRETRDTATKAYHRLLGRLRTNVTAQLDDARRVEPVRGFAGQAGCIKQSIGPGWALVGDASYFKDPITAHGITDALRDAELLSRAILHGNDRALAEYDQARDDLSRALFTITDRVASFDWTDAELEQLHRALSKELSREARMLAELELSAWHPPLVSVPRAV
jgi:putative flavoprotein involved in K+ transport